MRHRPSDRVNRRVADLMLSKAGYEVTNASDGEEALEQLEKVTTIADSLGAPFAMPYSFELCRRSVDEIVRVTDDELSAAMRFLFRRQKMVVESACASTTAAMLGPTGLDRRADGPLHGLGHGLHEERSTPRHEDHGLIGRLHGLRRRLS